MIRAHLTIVGDYERKEWDMTDLTDPLLPKTTKTLF